MSVLRDACNGCKVSTSHISACGNKCPRCVSWSECGQIAVGSCNSIAICNSRTKNTSRKFKHITHTLNEHTERVNCVEWVRRARRRERCEQPTSHYLLSGASDNAVICWKYEERTLDNFIPLAKLKHHSGAVTAVDGLILDQKLKTLSGEAIDMVIVSTGSDSSVLVWTCQMHLLEEGNIALLQEINYGNSLIMTIALHALPCGSLILACGLDNAKIELHTLTLASQSAADGINTHGNKEGEFSFGIRLHGHEDWVRSADFVTVGTNDLLLATCSQDTFIRLWRISCQQNLVDDKTDPDAIKLKENKFNVLTNNVEREYVVSLEAVLSGHDGWVYSVHWSPYWAEDSLRLLSASMDKSVIIWKMDTESGMWVENARFGEVGGNTLGFYGARFNWHATEVIAHSYNGALHVWEKGEDEAWKAGIAISGHFGPVLDLSWEPKFGRYLVSTSADQTTRLFSPWKVKDCVQKSWHEIARPQIHGYDMQCVSLVDSFKFISGADEKVLRVFEAPLNFLHNLEKLNMTSVAEHAGAAEGASVPALGLSNKAVFIKPPREQNREANAASRGQQYIENQFTSLVLDAPPPEEHLLQNTLWPEIRKLYSHVYEIFCTAANGSGTLVASAAKAATPEHSAISLWCSKTWKEVAKLGGHSLTVTQVQFSNDGEFLLSVSRDRTWILHKISGNGRNISTKMVAKSSKQNGHTRIVWSASWTHDDNYFCTSSRDKKIMFWKVCTELESPDSPEAVSKILTTDAGEPVTAVAFATRRFDSNYLLGVGKESGAAELRKLSVNGDKNDCFVLYKFGKNEAHALAVKRMEWRPMEENDDYYIATCGLDHMVKIFKVDIS